ncbi:hypothetical protein VFPFJ_09226 [Purpureocillium lilacinum]|uniref:Uncharacterized protein n=1 Tax=Purpureocillium lilacinum TaxID=33203 RepID=A0A179GSM7_PURLI|nr:hypothetical protein VFPFJ_09226 [Purpureocillium lilacinum]OAQ80772.1 hypothetical protein VFPFJ_09226 [Purpureocillium lilacinum]
MSNTRDGQVRDLDDVAREMRQNELENQDRDFSWRKQDQQRDHQEYQRQLEEVQQQIHELEQRLHRLRTLQIENQSNKQRDNQHKRKLLEEDQRLDFQQHQVRVQLQAIKDLRELDERQAVEQQPETPAYFPPQVSDDDEPVSEYTCSQVFPSW